MSDRSNLRLVPDLPAPEEWWLKVVVRPEEFDRARDALMYWEVGSDPKRCAIFTADIAPDDVRMALTDDTTGPIRCIAIERQDWSVSA